MSNRYASLREGMRSHATEGIIVLTAVIVCRFNTASGMRSHVTGRRFASSVPAGMFQYRKRYEITCDHASDMREITQLAGFNTTSGMRSHVTKGLGTISPDIFWFQYRKRYEITCDKERWRYYEQSYEGFNTASGMRSHVTRVDEIGNRLKGRSFNTASGMRSHVTSSRAP